MLILTTLAWSTSSLSGGYADIGYRTGELSMEIAMKVDGPVYIRAELGEDAASYGLGIGFDVQNFNIMLTADRVETDEFEYGVQVSYYDIGVSYCIDVSQRRNTGLLGYKIGVGYSINEGFSIMTHYSEKGAFVGFRKWF